MRQGLIPLVVAVIPLVLASFSRTHFWLWRARHLRLNHDGGEGELAEGMGFEPTIRLLTV